MTTLAFLVLSMLSLKSVVLVSVSPPPKILPHTDASNATVSKTNRSSNSSDQPPSTTTQSTETVPGRSSDSVVNGTQSNQTQAPDADRTKFSPNMSTPSTPTSSTPSHQTGNATPTTAPASPHPHPAEPSTTPSRKEAKENTSRTIIVVTLLSILVFIIILGCAHELWHRPGSNRSAPRLLLALRDRVAAAVRTTERRLGLHLWPRRKREELGEEEENVKGSNTEFGAGGEAGDRDVDAEDEDSSDDYSSLEGMNLRERARERARELEAGATQKKEEEPEEKKDDVEGPGDVRRGDDAMECMEEVVFSTSADKNTQGDACDVTVF